jgi:Ca2+-binding RTX toxin-like protein
VAAEGRLYVAGPNSAADWTAGGEIAILGTVVSGGSMDRNGVTTWRGANATVSLQADKVLVGGPLAGNRGSFTTIGGVIHATGDITLTARTLAEQSTVFIGESADVQSDPTASARALGGAASKVSLLSDGSVEVFGSVASRQTGSGIEIHAGVNGGGIRLHSANLLAAGMVTLAAPQGVISHSGGLIAADSLVAAAVGGISANLDVRKVAAEVSGTGNLQLRVNGDVLLDTIRVVGGAVTVQGGAGDDTISIGNFKAASTSSWTVDGGAGNDIVRLQGGITFAASHALNIDLSDDVPSPGIDRIIVEANTKLVLDSGAATLRATGSIEFQPGSLIDTVDGAVLVEANQQATATAGDFTGLTINGAQIRSVGAGSITLRGRGGNSSAGGQVGVAILGNSSIVAGRQTTVRMEGTGGASSGPGNVGLAIIAGTLGVNATAGGFQLSGFGGGTVGSVGNIGLSISSQAQLAAIGSFAIELTGRSGLHPDSWGLSVLGAVSAVANELRFDARRHDTGTGGGAIIGGAVSNATGAAILVRSDGDATFSAAARVLTAGGTLTVSADQDLSGLGAITMADGASFDAGSGPIKMDAAGEIMLGRLSTANASSSAVDIHSRLGGIVDAGDATVNIVAAAAGAAIALRSATGIGSTNALEIDARLIAALNTISGNIRLADIGPISNTLAIGMAGGLAGIVNQAEGGLVSVSNNGALVVAANVASVGSVALNALDDANALQTFVLNANTSVISSQGNVSIAAGDDLRADTGSVIQAANGGTITLSADVLNDQDLGFGATMWLSGAVRFGGTGLGTALLRTGADSDTIRLAGMIAAGAGTVALDAGAGDDILRLETGLPTGANVTFLGQDGSDVLRQDYDAPTRWEIAAANSGQVNVLGAKAVFQQWENLVGAAARPDQFVFKDGATLSGSLNARGPEANPTEADTLDYSDYKSRIEVDLTTGSATGIGGGIVAAAVGSSIENVIGGDGNDAIVCDVDFNYIRGNAGENTITGISVNDTLDGPAQTSVLQFSGNDFEFGNPQGGIDDEGQSVAIDIAVNVGNGPVTLNGFNSSFDQFANSIDIFDGAGFALQGNNGSNRIHLGFTAVRNTPLVSGGGGNDAMTTSHNNESATDVAQSYVTYDGGSGTDSVTLTFTPRQLVAMTLEDIKAVQAYVKSPTGKTLVVTDAIDKGNFRATGFESARIAIYDDQSVFDITSVFQGLASKSQIIVGTLGNDTIVGTSASEMIFGTEGDDVIDGGASNDFILGGAGNDRLNGGDNDDDLLGGSGNDSLYGNAKSDRLRGGSGVDALFGGDGVDWLDGESGNDVLYGEADLDTLRGSAGNDTLYGGLGNDTLLGEAGDDSLYGGDGNDVLDGGIDSRTRTGHDVIDGEAGDDEIRTRGNESEFDKIQGGGGSDRLTSTDISATPPELVLDAFDGLGNGIESIVGNKTRIVGNESANLLDFRRPIATNGFVALINVTAIDGGAGNDTIHGSSGNDTLIGGLGRDTLHGYAGNDVMDGGDDEDSLFGGAGGDQMQGGIGDDMLDGDMGVDTILGGEGHDTLVGGADNDALFGNAGNDLLNGGLGHDRLDGGAGNDRLFGDVGDDTLNGGTDGGTRAEFDVVDGGAGKDLIRTQGRESEFDSIQGGADLDTLINIGTSPSMDLVLDRFDGLSAGIEQLDANNARLTGNADNNRLDLRLNAAGTLFVKTLKLTRMAGLDGDDTIYGSGANETLDGGVGADSLYGMAGNDVLFGGAGADYMEGGAGADTLNGEAGADTLRGGDGVDQLVFNGDLDSLDRVEDLAAADFLQLVGYGPSVTYPSITFDASSQMLVVPTTPFKRIMLSSLKAKPAASKIKLTSPSGAAWIRT